MELCKYCNIVFDDLVCPVCEANDTINSLEEKIRDLEEKIIELEEERNRNDD